MAVGTQVGPTIVATYDHARHSTTSLFIGSKVSATAPCEYGM